MKIKFSAIAAFSSILLLSGLALPSYGTTVACYDYACDWDTDTCDFDASCSSGTPYIWKINFTWGDGSSTGLTGDLTQTHTFTHNDCASDVTLKVISWNGEFEEVTCNVIHSHCQFGGGIPASYAFGNCTSN